MLESKLSHLVDPLREMIFQFGMVIGRFREESGAVLAGVTCDMFPAEITAALGLVPLRIPSLMIGRCTAAGASSLDGIGETYDLLVVPRGCAGRDGLSGRADAVSEFFCPSGWGEESCRGMEASMEKLLERAGRGGLSRLDPAVLSSVTAMYNRVRRAVRGIAAARREKPDLLSCRDLGTVMEAAMVFPPAVTADFLAAVLDGLNRTESAVSAAGVPVMVYAGFAADAAVLDEIEEAGCLVVEDDACGGRRQFDMSYNHESAELYHEILDAFSYRPRCPSVRTVEERTALLYSMIKGHGIEAVIFIEDLCCPARGRDIGELRVRLMRSGVDPLVVTTVDAADTVREYVSRM
ncbi:MAG TPA: 2-hydroxyacyl-CoA dehydratase family protein [Spirochaetota bacterium]|nr:2-hydroxyacyl-CoA dehydratase family protein [Spirochaetota bacterium]HQJ71454.1 2-hydroxyacyl-CoA dehydratase family protein [Spirochaetota bacterium]HRS77568.1 2-hydroxyacyl-CoA dehydratase family protein [Spirochaetota bacterium]HRT75167.1 2-hydroxyacyl-CoA dehydratase family protein [Spirochaetota bacterium]